MTKNEIKKMVNTCNNYHNCGGCPYNPKDISRFIGDRWKGGCPNYDDKLVYAMGKGYGKISKYKAEIKRLKAEFKQLETNAEILARGVRDLNHENYELTEQVKRAKIDVLNKLKTQTHNYYPSIDSYCVSQHVVLVKDIDKMIVEVQNAEDKS